MKKISKRINYIANLPEVLRNKIVFWWLSGAGMLLVFIITMTAAMSQEFCTAVFVLACICWWFGYKIYYMTTRALCDVREGTIINFDYAFAIPRLSFKKGVYRIAKAVLIEETGGRLIKVKYPIKEKLEKGMRIKIYLSRKSDGAAYTSNGIKVLSDIIAYELVGMSEEKN